jgi:hypothetical protein
VALIQIRGRQFLPVLIIGAEDAEAVERVSLVNMRRALGERVTVIPTTGLRSAGADVLNLMCEFIAAS